jgi:hypothetical protein
MKPNGALYQFSFSPIALALAMYLADPPGSRIMAPRKAPGA